MFTTAWLRFMTVTCSTNGSYSHTAFDLTGSDYRPVACFPAEMIRTLQDHFTAFLQRLYLSIQNFLFKMSTELAQTRQFFFNTALSSARALKLNDRMQAVKPAVHHLATVLILVSH